MSKRISDNKAGGEHVLEQLSAYIDNALGAGERERVRAHIETCDGCRNEHRELQATRQMLLSMPVARPPRAFTLTQEMVASKPSLWQRLRVPRWYPRLATGSVVAFALLVMLLLGDLAGNSFLRNERMAAPASSDLVTLNLATPDAASKMGFSVTPTAATQAEAVEAPESTAMAMSGEVEATQVAQAAPPAEPATGGAGSDVPSTSEPAANTDPALAPTIPSSAYDSSTVPQATVAAPGPGVIGGPPFQGRDGSQPAPPTEQPVVYSPPPANDASWAVILQVSLAVLGVALGLGAIIARMRGV
jgi:anti-sigma factor RsiW